MAFGRCRRDSPQPLSGGFGGTGQFCPASGVPPVADALGREGMTMEAAARQLQVSVKTVSRWVRGATEPRLCDLTRIREIFDELPFP